MSNSLESDGLQEQWQSLSSESRRRQKRKIGFSLLIAALIALLLWNTQWPFLKPGLIVLLAGQIAIAAFWTFRIRRRQQPDDLDALIEGEASANRQAVWLENGSRLLGFVLLAIGFWRTTGNVIVSLALGVVYPALSFWGFARSAKRR
jgi:Ca2+/Na+ antiporter